MASIERRLAALGESLSDDLRALEPDRAELARSLFLKAYRSLSIVEMHFMDELREVYWAHPGLSPAGIWHELSEAQRAMEYRWLDVTRTAARDLLETNELPRDEEAELKDLVQELGNYPFWQDG